MFSAADAGSKQCPETYTLRTGRRVDSRATLMGWQPDVDDQQP